MDKTDKKILDLLKGNARMTYQQLGDELGMSRVAAQKRVKKLEEAGIIRGYNTTIYRDDEVLMLLSQKWIVPLYTSLTALPGAVVDSFIKQITYLNEKYATTLVDLDDDIRETETAFVAMLDDLTGNDYDMQGIAELRMLLGGE